MMMTNKSRSQRSRRRSKLRTKMQKCLNLISSAFRRVEPKVKRMKISAVNSNNLLSLSPRINDQLNC